MNSNLRGLNMFATLGSLSLAWRVSLHDDLTFSFENTTFFAVIKLSALDLSTSSRVSRLTDSEQGRSLADIRTLACIKYRNMT